MNIISVSRKITNLLISILLLFIVFVLIAVLPSYNSFDIEWWILLTIIIGFLGVSLWGIYKFGQPVLVQWLQLTYPQQFRFQNPSQIIELAKLHYYINDPSAPSEFETFLDSRILTSGKNSGSGQEILDTPREFIENAIIRFAHRIEQMNDGDLSVKVNIKHGSLGIDLVVLGAIYANVALWRDFNDSINLIRQQVQTIIRRTSDWYRDITGRDIEARTDIAIEAISAAAKNKLNEISPPVEGVNETTPPISVTNAGSSPSTTNTVYVNLGSESPFSKFYRWLGSLLLSVVLITAAIYLLLDNSYVHCRILNNSNLCYWVSQELAFRLSGIFGGLSEFFFNLSQSIMP